MTQLNDFSVRLWGLNIEIFDTYLKELSTTTGLRTFIPKIGTGVRAFPGPLLTGV
jgi:hypothetical protein